MDQVYHQEESARRQWRLVSLVVSQGLLTVVAGGSLWHASALLTLQSLA